MRRIAALISLFPVAVLFLGTVRLGSICATRSAAQCSTTVEKNGCGATKCCHKKKDMPKEKDGYTCCLECPLCAPVTISPEIRLAVVPPELTIEYAVVPDNELSDFSREHWKPPDFTLLS